MRLARLLCLVAGLSWLAPAYAQLTFPGVLRQPPPAKCVWSRGPSGPGALFVAKREVAAVAFGAVHIWMVRAGNRIVLSPTGVELGAHVVVQISAKMAEASDTFTEVCKRQRMDGSRSDLMLRVNAPLGSADVLWRIEVRFGKQGKVKSRLPVTLTVQDVSIARDESAWKQGIPLHGMLCLNDIPEMLHTKPTSHQFGGRLRLEVNSQQTTYPVTAEQQSALADAVLSSVALWVRACIACRLEHLVIVLIDGRVYTRASANDWLEGVAKRRVGASNHVAPSAEDEKELERLLQPVVMLRAGPQMHTSLTGKDLERYGAMPEASRAFLCRLQTSPETQRSLDALRRAACGQVLAKGEVSRIRVRFRDGPTACGDDPNVIACRSDLELTEYNVRNYRFRVEGEAPVDIGSGPIDVNLQHVIAHEMGHWIGLKHINKGQSLMSSSMEDSRCIDVPTVDGLLAQDGEPSKAEFPQAFTMVRRRKPM